jgi:hypothetical protein
MLALKNVIVKPLVLLNLIINLYMSNNLEKNDLYVENENKDDIFSDINYICKTTPLIVESLKNGLDVAQLPNGDILTTEVKTVNTQYSWDKTKQRLFKASQG